MSQLSLPAGAGKPAAAGPTSDTPDVLFVLRQRRWLIVMGTLLGTLISIAAYIAVRKYMPLYSASVRYQVLPIDRSLMNITSSDTGNEVTAEDASRFIRRQAIFIREQDMLLDEVLKDDAVQKDPYDLEKEVPNPRESKWWAENKGNNPRLVLRNALSINPVTGSDVFEVSMTGSDPREVKEIVTAVGRIYIKRLQDLSKTSVADVRDTNKAARTELDNRIHTLEADLENFRLAHNIPGLITNSTRKTTLLASLDIELARAEQQLASAQSSYDAITPKAGGPSKVALDPQEEQYVENDPTLKMLENNQLQLEEDKAVAVDKYGPDHSSVKAIDIRINFIKGRADEMKGKLTDEARQRMIDKAQSDLAQAKAIATNFKDRHDQVNAELADLDRWIVQFNTRAENLTNQRQLFKEMDQKVTMMDIKQNTDESRVKEFISASIPTEPVSPVVRLYVISGVSGGLILSFLLAYLLELTNTRVRTPRDITRTMQMPLLGFVPDQEDDSFVNGDLMTTIRTSPSSMIAESFRQIRGRLAAQAHNQPLTSLLIASVSPGGGATTVASNLANGIALNEVRVLLVDANFYRPGLKKIYGNIPEVGLADVVSGKATLDDAIVPSLELPTLHVMGPGSKPPATSAELFEGKAFREILTQMKAKYDMVIFDGAPLSVVSDSVSLAAKLDGAIAVVRAGVLSRGTVTRVRDQLRQVRANFLGIVLNAAQTHGSGYFKENYKTFYKYASKANMPLKPQHSN